jgi:hypothetical protein
MNLLPQNKNKFAVKNIIIFLICLLFIFSAIKCITLNETFDQTNNKIIYTDIFHSIFNMYNPYASIYDNPTQIITNKCYYTNNIVNVQEIINYYNNIINLPIDSDINTIHITYIKNFIVNSYNLTRKTNYLFHYYNSILRLEYFFDVISNKIIDKDYDDYTWINVCYSTIINNNMIFVRNITDYNNILLISEYVLEELIKYAKKYFNTYNIFYNVNKNDSLYKIKNNLMYNDSGDYFTQYNIFNCKI